MQYRKFFYFYHSANDFVLPHRHDCYELVYYKGGNGNVNIDTEIYAFEDDTLVLVGPDIVHDDYSKSETDVYCLQFDSDCLNVKSSVIKKNVDESITGKIFEIMKNFNDNISHRVESADFDSEMYVKFVELLLMQLMNFRKQEDYYFQVVSLVKTYLQKNMHTKINFEILSEQIGYSVSRLRAIFVEYSGETVYQYLSGIRLAKAKRLLKDTNMKIDMIRKECGFKSKERFSLFFTEKMKMSLRTYRKLMKDLQNKDTVYNTDTHQEVF